jgi:hypothetical protein
MFSARSSFEASASTSFSFTRCADYRRKLPWATPDVLRQRQARDAVELAHLRHEWAADATVTVFRCEVGASHAVTFRPLDAARELEGSAWGEPFVRRRQ